MRNLERVSHPEMREARPSAGRASTISNAGSIDRADNSDGRIRNQLALTGTLSLDGVRQRALQKLDPVDLSEEDLWNSRNKWDIQRRASGTFGNNRLGRDAAERALRIQLAALLREGV